MASILILSNKPSGNLNEIVFVEGFKFAKVWGSQVHDATVVKDDYIPADRDIVELHM